MAQAKPPRRLGPIIRNSLFWASLVLIVLVAIGLATPKDPLKPIAISDLITQANEGKIAKIEIEDNNIKVTPRGTKKHPTLKHPTLKSHKEGGSSIYEQGLNKNSKTEVVVSEPSSTGPALLNIAGILLPILLLGGLFYFMFRQAQGQSNQALGFGRSKAKLYGTDKEKVIFEDIAGNNEAKVDLHEIVDFLKHPKKFEAVGAKIPRGVLLVGPPGTGKTMLARAVAGEANVPFFSISGSEFVEMFVGVGASRVRDLFTKAKKNSPSIIFIDEIDAVGRRRGSGMGGGHDEREQTLNQILVEMDGFEQGSNVIVVAATNRADVLDPALLRPGRFDRRVQITLPERKDREAILKVHFKKKPIDDSVSIDALAAKTAGSSGADLANIANEAAIVAARHNRKTINNSDVTEAFEKVAIGPERKTKIMSEKDKEMTAYHEAGHALVGHILPDSDPVHKVTIIPRGATGGITWFLPPEDKNYTSIVEFKDVLARALGGRVAEKLKYGVEHVTTGASNDLRKATDIARDMIIEQGMGSKLRDQVFHEDGGGMMFDRMVHSRPYSEDTAREIDSEVEALIKEAAHRAEIILKKNLASLEVLKKALLAKETVDEPEIGQLLKDMVLPKEVALY